MSIYKFNGTAIRDSAKKTEEKKSIQIRGKINEVENIYLDMANMG
jgi:hypothetical protein